MEDYNNWRHVPISLEITWTTKLWHYHNLVWYLLVSEVNTYHPSGQFKNDGVVQPSLYFQRVLAMECLENTIGVELVNNEGPNKTNKIGIYVACVKIIVKHHGGMWDPIYQKEKI